MERRGRGSKLMASVGPYVVLAALCLTSSLQPSLPSALYYLVFLLGATWWALCQNIQNRFFAGLFALLALFVSIHIFALYLYQTQWAQEFLPSDSLLARYVRLNNDWPLPRLVNCALSTTHRPTAHHEIDI
jgi:hypothetical protein